MRYLFLLFVIASCQASPVKGEPIVVGCSLIPPLDTACFAIINDSVAAANTVAFAKTFLGTPYKFGCSAPSTGFDCSGFISYVLHHSGIEAPRSSIDFTNAGATIPLDNARVGDLILFTGTNSAIRTVGHIGLVVAVGIGGLRFIHASSGSDYAVIITLLNEGYKQRFVKIVRMKK